MRVVIVGGGFGGLQAANKLGKAGRSVEVTLIDRHNYHLFQPLSYQVATGALAPGDIAVPLRHVFRRRKNIRVLMAEVTGFDLSARRVVFDAGSGPASGSISYDALVVAAGSDYSYFGHDAWRSVALEVKSLDSALEVRGRILHAFEAAELHPDEQESWLTFVVVGAGPTGVEMAGQIAELAHDTLRGEFRSIDPKGGRVLLVEAGDRALAGFRDPLPKRAAKALKQLGVTLVLSHTVVGIDDHGVELQAEDGARERINARTVIWAAGVTASSLASTLADAAGDEVDRAGRLTVELDLSLPGHPEVMAIGDMVRVRDPETGQAVALPGLAPVAMQQGRYVGALIARRGRGKSEPGPFHYRDKGTLATIGRARAVADVRGVRFSGLLAWQAWLVIHIFYLIGFENRIVVLMRWAYSYFTRGRGSRLITEAAAIRESGSEGPGGSAPQ
jgi:NADH dehydrogenase